MNPEETVTALHSPDARTWIGAFRALVELCPVERLLVLLRSPDADVRWRAVVALGWIGDAQVIPSLVDLIPDAEYAVKLNMMWALGQIGDASAVPILLEILCASGDEPDIRYAAALALTRLEQADALRSALNQTDESIYRVAHAALATIPFQK